MQYDTFGVERKVNSGNPSGLGLRIFAKHLIQSSSKTKSLFKVLHGGLCVTVVSFQSLLRGLGFETSRTLSTSRMHLFKSFEAKVKVKQLGRQWPEPSLSCKEQKAVHLLQQNPPYVSVNK